MARKKSAEHWVLVLGDVNVDLLAIARSWPRQGEECLTDHLELHCGGVGANCAFSLRQWDILPHLVACVGHDPLGEMILANLAAHGVELHHIKRTHKAMTGLLYINVTPGGQRTFFGSRGANCLVQPEPGQRALVRRSQAVSLMGYSFLDPGPTRTASQILTTARALGKFVSLDAGMEPSQKIPEKILRIVRKVDLLFVSSEEAAALTGRHDARDAFRALQQAGVPEIVMKLGKRGCLLSDGVAIRQVPAFAVRAVDSTGAGDAFNAAFLQAKLRGWPANESALLANAAGAIAAGTIGAGDAAPSPKHVLTLLLKSRFDKVWETVRLNVVQRLRSDRSGNNARRKGAGQSNI
jgi:ribokinase